MRRDVSTSDDHNSSFGDARSRGVWFKELSLRIDSNERKVYTSSLQLWWGRDIAPIELYRKIIFPSRYYIVTHLLKHYV